MLCARSFKRLILLSLTLLGFSISSNVTAAIYKFEFHAAKGRASYTSSVFGQIDPGELLLDITIEAEPPYGLPNNGPDRFQIYFFSDNRDSAGLYGKITNITAHSWGRFPTDQPI